MGNRPKNRGHFPEKGMIAANPESMKNGEIMKKKSSIASILLLLLMVSSVQVVSALDGSSGTQKQDLASVYVSSVTMDPAVLYPYETGTVSVTLTNAGNTSVGVSNPDLISTQVHVTKKDTWNTMSYIVSGSTITYQFIVTGAPPDGSYFALFTIETANGATVHYPLIIKIDSRDLTASVSDKPDTFPLSSPQIVNLTIVNPRQTDLKNFLITAAGEGLEVSPSQKYLSSIGSYNSTEIPFEVTAHQTSNLTFLVSYQSGDVIHTTSETIPVTIGNDKTAAVPIVNNLALTTKGSYYDLTGDITNSGVTDAKGLVVTVGSPAQGVETYPEYAIGALATDDSGSFEVTFTAKDLSAVPLVIRWKGSDGGDYSVTKTLDLTSTSGTTGNTTGSGASGTQAGGPGSMGGPGGSSTTSLFSGSNSGGLSSFYPVIAAGILVVVGIVLYIKRKWLALKLKRQ
jgi:hypothetical protein